MCKKGENIFLRKDGRWEARYVKERQSKKIKYGFVYGKTYSEAKQKKRIALMNIIINKNIKKDKFEYYINLWLNTKKNIVKQSTYCYYMSTINNHIKPFFNNKLVSDINIELINIYIDNLLSKKFCNKKISNKTVKDILIIFRQILKFAGNNIAFHIPKVNKNSIEVFSIEEQKKFEEYTKNAASKEIFFLYLCLYTGLRIGEICALKWSDIDINNGLIKISRTLIRVKNLDPKISTKTKLIFSEPKTNNSKRIIPLPIELINKLKQYKTFDNDFVLTGSNKFIEPRSYYNKYKKLLKDIGLKNYKFHILRHTFASRCIEKGFDAKTLSEILGHSNINLTLSLYVHLDLESKRYNMEKLFK